MNRTEIKAEIRQIKRQYKESLKHLKRWISNPSEYLRHGCDGGKESEIQYAAHLQGNLEILERWEKELACEASTRTE